MAAENDIVLIHFEDQPIGFARIEEILPDNKPDWYHVKLLMLQVPLQTVTWILRDRYINGEEYTMNGKRMRIEKVVCPKDPVEDADTNDNEENRDSGKSKVISLADMKKK